MFTLMILFVLLCLPNALWAWFHHDAPNFLFNFLVLLSVFALLKRSRLTIIFMPFVLLLPAVLFYVWQYRAYVNQHILAIIAETHYQEAMGFIGKLPTWYAVMLLLWLVMVLVLSTMLWKSAFSWQHRSRYWVMIATAIYCCLSYLAFDSELSYPDELKTPSSRTIEDNFLAQNEFFLLNDLQTGYPFGLFIAYHNWQQDKQNIQEFSKKTAHFKFHAKQNPPHETQTVVLVIGETGRRNHWQIHGYERPTNPLLSQQNNLISLNNMLSIANATRLSVPLMITRKPQEQQNNFNFYEKSIISAFKEAGFHTYWLSNQQAYGMHDNSISVYAQEADVTKFINFTGYRNIGNLDGALLPHFAQILQQPHNKKFIIVHTMGSHSDYSHRYPKEFGKFKPDFYDLDTYNIHESQYATEITNSFDNSILYTDKVLNDIIEQLKQHNAPSFLLYAADHGEDLISDNCQLSGHGHLSRFNFEISAFAWYSPNYAQEFPMKIQSLKDNQNKKMNHTVLFPTLLDSADIVLASSTPNHRSILNEQYQEFNRLVAGFDYDGTAQNFYSTCQESSHAK